MKKIDITKLTDNSRYSDVLDELLKELGIKNVLRLEYEASYQGEVDIDAELKDGRVFSYHYFYGSCSGCDDWEARNLTVEQIKKEMKKEATFFKSVETWLKWRKKVVEANGKK